MDLQPLTNHLISHRKKAALSQAEVSYLLGSEGAAKVSKHEKFHREPCLQTALAYQVIFGTPISDLFPGLFAKAQLVVQERAAILEKQEFGGNSKSFIAHKRQTLAALSNKFSKN